MFSHIITILFVALLFSIISYLNIPLYVLIFIVLVKEFFKYKNFKLIKNEFVKQNNNFIHFNILVCAKNEEKRIYECLSSLNSINYPKDKYDIILIDDNSNDNTVKVALSFFKEFNIKNYKIVSRKRKDGFVAGVLNDGIKEFDLEKKSFFGIIDADCTISKDILKIANNHINSDNLDGLQVQEWHTTSDNIINSAQHILCIYENYNNFQDKIFKVGHFFSNKIAKKVVYNENSILEDALFSEECNNLDFKIKVIKDVLLFRKFSSNIFKVYSQQYRYQLGTVFNDSIKKKFMDNMLIPLLILFTIIFDINLLVNIIILLLLEIFGNIYYYYPTYYQLARINLPLTYKKTFDQQKYVIFNPINIVGTIIFILSIVIIRLITFIRQMFYIEQVKWNRF